MVTTPSGEAVGRPMLAPFPEYSCMPFSLAPLPVTVPDSVPGRMAMASSIVDWIPSYSC